MYDGFMVIVKILFLISGLILPAICGMAIIDLLQRCEFRRCFEYFILSFLLGWGVFSLFFVFFGFCGIPLNFISGIVLIAIIYIFAKFANTSQKYSGNRLKNHLSINEKTNQKKNHYKVIRENKFTNIVTITLIVLSCTLFILLFMESIADTDSYPLQGVWGYKAMVIYKESTIPIKLFNNPTLIYTHQTYPLGYPVMLAWCYMSISEFNDSLIKLIPPLLGVLIFLSIYTILRKEKITTNVSLLLSLIFCGSGTFNLCSTILYAENLMLLYVLWGVSLLYRNLKNNKNQELLGIMLLALATWIKNEGIVYFMTIGVLIIIFHLIRKEKTKILKSLALFAIIATFLILPWMFFKYYFHIETRDFNILGIVKISLSKTMSILKLSALEFSKTMFVNIKETCGLWYLFIIIFVLHIKEIVKQKEMMLFTFSTLLTITMFCGVFIFSTRELSWHMDAIPRLLYTPTVIFMIFLTSSQKYGKKS